MQVDSHGGPWRNRYTYHRYTASKTKVTKENGDHFWQDQFGFLEALLVRQADGELKNARNHCLSPLGWKVEEQWFCKHFFDDGTKLKITIYIYSKVKQPLIIDDTNNEIDDSFHQWIQRRENLFTNYKLSFLARRDGCVGCWYCITYLAVIEWGAIHN